MEHSSGLVDCASGRSTLSKDLVLTYPASYNAPHVPQVVHANTSSFEMEKQDRPCIDLKTLVAHAWAAMSSRRPKCELKTSC